MSFSVEVPTGAVSVEPGSTAPGTLTVTNLADKPVEFEIVIEGLDAEWTAVPVPVFVLEPGASQTERFFLKPPRTPESTAGTYPYAVTVRSLETGETRKSPAILELKPFHHLTVDFNPRRVSVAYNRGALVEVMVANLGNSEHRVQLSAADQDNVFAFEFEGEGALLASGQQKKVPLVISATKPSLLSNPRLSPFSVAARSADIPSVATSVQGQAEQRALLSPGAFFLALLVIGMAVLWWAFLPKPPRLEAFTASKTQITLGEPVQLSWSSQDASYVRIKIGGEDAQRMPKEGQHSFTPAQAGPLDIQGVAVRDGRESAFSFVRIDVKPVPKAPAPVIEKFEVNPRKIRLGEGVLVTYKLSDSVTQAVLEPFTTDLDPRSTSYQITPTLKGETTIKLIARNSDRVSVQKTITINVTDESRAEISKFAVSPKEVKADAGETVRITWALEGAYRAELKIGDVVTPLNAASGVQEVVIMKDTEIKITAWDAESRSVSKTSTVRAKSPAPPPVENPPTGEPVVTPTADPTGDRDPRTQPPPGLN